MKKVLAWVIVIGFLMVLFVGGAVDKVNEEHFFDKLPVAFYKVSFDFYEPTEFLDFIIDSVGSVAFLFKAEPEMMLSQKFGNRIYLYVSLEETEMHEAYKGWLVGKDENGFLLGGYRYETPSMPDLYFTFSMPDFKPVAHRIETVTN